MNAEVRAGAAAALLLLTARANAQTPAPAVENVRVIAPAKSVTGVTGTAAGGGLIGEETVAKSQSTVSVDFIAKQVPIANSFDLLRLEPGANTATSDPYGLSPGVNITLRGLNGDEVAYLLEGAPLNDIGYYAGYPSQWADSENIKTIALAQGTADLDTPTVNAGGGLINLQLRDPAPTPGGLVSASYGSYHMARGFVRVDTGLIGDTGIAGICFIQPNPGRQLSRPRPRSSPAHRLQIHQIVRRRQPYRRGRFVSRRHSQLIPAHQPCRLAAIWPVRLQ